MKLLLFLAPILVTAALLWSLVLQPFWARSDALAAQRDRLLAQRDLARTQIANLSAITPEEGLPESAFWTAETPALTLSRIQSVVSASARENRVTLSSISTRPAKAVGEYSKFALAIEADGLLEDIAPLLASLEAHDPPLRIERLQLRTRPTNATDVAGTTVYAQFELWGLVRPVDAQ